MDRIELIKKLINGMEESEEYEDAEELKESLDNMLTFLDIVRAKAAEYGLSDNQSKMIIEQAVEEVYSDAEREFK